MGLSCGSAGLWQETVVCSTLELCDEVSRKHGLDAITLEGDKVSSRGTLTGGFQDPARFVRLSQAQKLRAAKDKVEAIRPRLVQIEQEAEAAYSQLDELHSKRRELQEDRGSRRTALIAASEAVEDAEGRAARQEELVRQNQERCAELQSHIAQYEAAIAAMESEMKSKTLGELTAEEELQLKQLGEEPSGGRPCVATRSFDSCFHYGTRPVVVEIRLAASAAACHKLQREIQGKEQHLKDFLRKRLHELEVELRRDVPGDHEVVDRLQRAQKESEASLQAAAMLLAALRRHPFLALIPYTVAAIIWYSRWRVAKPDEWLLVLREGKLLGQGIGLRAFCGWQDSIVKFPASIQKISFQATQVDKEMQGLSVSGYLSWSVNRSGEGPWNAYKYMAMRDLDGDGTVDSNAGSQHIAELAKAVVRSQVANSTLSEVLTQRDDFRTAVKSKVMEQVEGWGVWVEAIEIAEVRICSARLFEDLQASHRQQVRLQAEEARMDTERRLQERKLQDELQVCKAQAEADAEKRLSTARQRLRAEQAGCEDA
ncbi:unnamed protein product [Effrenium voratum]|nr:unnamed protein product [Effrenium voratum]